MASGSAGDQSRLVWRSEPRSSGKSLVPAPAKAKAPAAFGIGQRGTGGGNRGSTAGLQDMPVLDLLDQAASVIQQLRPGEERAKLEMLHQRLTVQLQEAPDGEWKCLKCNSTNWVDRPCCKRCKELRADMDLLHKAQAAKNREKRSLSEGKGGGFFDRQAVDKKEWNSDDEELDEFGRKKRRRKA